MSEERKKASEQPPAKQAGASEGSGAKGAGEEGAVEALDGPDTGAAGDSRPRGKTEDPDRTL